jgi:glycerol-3-phosphate acyltransferase PlsY
MANAYRVGGAIPAGLVLLGDALKGALPVLAARHLLGLPDLAVVLIGAAAIAGHDFPVFLRGHGGKGVATSLGVILALAPPVALAAGLIWLLVILISRYASLASLTMLGAASVLMLVYDLVFLGWRHLVVTLFVVALFFVAVYRHRTNIDRLMHGRELKITEKPEQAA